MEAMLVLSALLVILAGLIALCLVGIWQGLGRRLDEFGHLAVSFLPWVHLAGAYAWALYVRKGMGYHDWPCACDMPRVNDFNAIPMWSTVFVLFFLLPVWLSWAIIRRRRGARSYWALSTAVFAAGIIVLVLLLWLDPWGVWNWITSHWA